MIKMQGLQIWKHICINPINNKHIGASASVLKENSEALKCIFSIYSLLISINGITNVW